MFCSWGWQPFPWRSFGPLGPLLFLGLAALAVWFLGRALRPASRDAGVVSCRHCGRSLDASWAFCPVCGKASGTAGRTREEGPLRVPAQEA